MKTEGQDDGRYQTPHRCRIVLKKNIWFDRKTTYALAPVTTTMGRPPINSNATTCHVIHTDHFFHVFRHMKISVDEYYSFSSYTMRPRVVLAHSLSSWSVVHPILAMTTTFPKHVTVEYHIELPLYNFFMHTGHSSSKYAISKKQSWQEPSKTIVDRSPPPYRLPLFACALFVTLVMAFTSLRSLSPSIFDTVARMDNFHPS